KAGFGIPLHSSWLVADAKVSPLIAASKFGAVRRGPVFLRSVRIEGLCPDITMANEAFFPPLRTSSAGLVAGFFVLTPQSQGPGG
ncbi:MAG: hypothetical protein VXW23_06750, partial [Planctomycetota bacterium]|nr:hypothetical protein [Planctomycetota bacterium]